MIEEYCHRIVEGLLAIDLSDKYVQNRLKKILQDKLENHINRTNTRLAFGSPNIDLVKLEQKYDKIRQIIELLGTQD